MLLKTDIAYSVQPVVLLSVPRGGAEFTWHDRARMNQERKTLFPTVLCARSHFDPRLQFNERAAAQTQRLFLGFLYHFTSLRLQKEILQRAACEDFNRQHAADYDQRRRVAQHGGL